jgi:dTDP-4-dehydrorhamnose reductase
MRLLAFGGWGQLGSELAIAAAGRHELIRPSSAEADVTDRGEVDRALMDARPDAVLNLAAFHKVEACERDPASAFAVNAIGAWNVAAAAAHVGARCLFVSSDYVFGGEDPNGYTEAAPMDPVNVYGASKEAGERLVGLACPDSLIVRGSGLFGHTGSSGKGGNFVETVLGRAVAGEPLSVVDDQVLSPTPARDMAQRMLALLERQAPPGMYHAASAGRCSWYDFAEAILDIAGVSADLARRSSQDDPIRRPSCSVLIDTKSSALGLPPLRPWRDGLEWYLANRHTPAGAVDGVR